MYTWALNELVYRCFAIFILLFPRGQCQALPAYNQSEEALKPKRVGVEKNKKLYILRFIWSRHNISWPRLELYKRILFRPQHLGRCMDDSWFVPLYRVYWSSLLTWNGSCPLPVTFSKAWSTLPMNFGHHYEGCLVAIICAHFQWIFLFCL